MSETTPATSVQLSQAVVQIPYFLDHELQQQVLIDPSALDTGIIGERQLVHVAALRLIATERLREGQQAWQTHVQSLSEGQEPPRRTEWLAAWRTEWQFTEERRHQVMDRHPLLVRRAGRQLMRLQNEGRFDPGPTPPGPAIRGAELLHGHTVEPALVATHLHRAGYQHRSSAVATRRQQLDSLPYPPDAQTYLQAFPPVEGRRPDEHALHAIAGMLNMATDTLESIVLEHHIFPTVRLDGYLREQEYYTPEAIDRMREIIDRMPFVNPESEARLSDLYETYGWQLVEAAASDLGATTFLRRHLHKRHVRCIARAHLPRLEARLRYLTTIQEGEMGYDDLAAALEVSRSAAQAAASDADRARARWLRPGPDSVRRRGRTVFPPHVIAEILNRRRQYLTPDLLPEVAMAARYPELLKSQRVAHILRRLSDRPVRLQLMGSSQAKKCRPWEVLRDLDGQLDVPADAVPILWDDLPRGQFELDPLRIAYARELQALLSSPNHVDPTPISVWIGRVHERLGTFAMTAAPAGARQLPIISAVVNRAARIGDIRTGSEGPPRPRRRRAALSAPIVFAADEPEPPAIDPSDSLAAQTAVFGGAAIPAGERPYGRYGPARARLSAEAAARHAPPRYSILVPPAQIMQRTRSRRLSVADISEATGAPPAVVQASIAARRSMFKTPPKELRRGVTVECYEGGQLDALLVDLVGLSPQQMARRLNLPEEEITAQLRGTPARANAQGRYSNATWERLRVDLRLAPPEQWQIADFISGMSEEEVVALASSLGVTVNSYYVRGLGQRPHVSVGGGKLLQAQFDMYYDEDSLRYPSPHADWHDRYELAEIAGCTPETVDAWMATKVQSSSDTEWAQVRNEQLRGRNIRVLPHYNKRLCDGFLQTMRQHAARG